MTIGTGPAPQFTFKAIVLSIILLVFINRAASARVPTVQITF